MAIKEYNKDVLFANWNPFYSDLFDEIKDIRKVGSVCYKNTKDIELYYARVANLYDSISFAIDKKNKDIETKLDVIETKIFNQNIENLLKSKRDEYRLKLFRQLRKIFKTICSDLSDASLMPKITITKKYNPNKAIMDSTY